MQIWARLVKFTVTSDLFRFNTLYLVRSLPKVRQLSNTSTESVVSPVKAPKKRWFRPLVFMSTLGLGTFIGLSQNQRVKRSFRAASACLLVILDYKWSFRKIQPDDPDYSKVQAQVHQRSANKMLNVCRRNGGCFIKLAQYIASMNHVLPPEYTKTLAVLQDKAVPRPYSEVETTIMQELNAKPNDLFSEFDEIPVASASLAQVHHARLKSGEEVAVKIQYLGLYDEVISDLLTIKFLAKPIGWAFPSFEFGWFVPDFEKDMAMELDFEHEAMNSERMAQNFSGNTYLKIPKVHWEKTTKKLLTMEWCPGVKITDVEGLEKLGVNKNEVATIFTELFSEQLFIHGFLHADPHPGNIFVRIKQGTKKTPELILLDHGLCQEIPPEVRIPYCRLWKAIVLQNPKEIEKQARELGAGDFHMLFRFILTFRPENPDTSIKMTQEEKALLKTQFKADNRIVKDLLKYIRRELLMVLKTQAFIRSINNELGAKINRFVIMARYSIMGIRATDSKPKSIVARIGSFKELVIFDIMLRLYSIGMLLSTIWGKFLGIFGFTSNTTPSLL